MLCVVFITCQNTYLFFALLCIQVRMIVLAIYILEIAFLMALHTMLMSFLLLL